MKTLFLLFCFLASFIIKPSSSPVFLKKISGGLTSPVAMSHAGDGSGRLFICEQNGRVRLLKNGLLQKTPFLDIHNKLIRLSGSYSECGLLGIAFHPQFRTNKKFYVYYSAPSDKLSSHHKSIIASYKVSTVNRRCSLWCFCV